MSQWQMPCSHPFYREEINLNEHVLNNYALRTRSFANRDREGRVVRPEVLGHVHNHGSQIQTLKKKLHKVNTNAQYTIVAMTQTTIQYSVYDGWYFGNCFFAELRWYAIVRLSFERSTCHTIARTDRHLGCMQSTENEILFFLAAKSCVWVPWGVKLFLRAPFWPGHPPFIRRILV